MLETVFWTVVNMSITASVAIVLVLAARLLLRRAAASVLWLAGAVALAGIQLRRLQIGSASCRERV